MSDEEVVEALSSAYQEFARGFAAALEQALLVAEAYYDAVQEAVRPPGGGE